MFPTDAMANHHRAEICHVGTCLSSGCPARSLFHLFYLKEAVTHKLEALHFHKPIKQNVDTWENRVNGEKVTTVV